MGGSAKTVARSREPLDIPQWCFRHFLSVLPQRGDNSLSSNQPLGMQRCSAAQATLSCVFPEHEVTAMGVKIRQKDGKWYVFIYHYGRRKAKYVGDSKRAAEEVKRKLEGRLTLGELSLLLR
jgi:hypothetical protein